MNRTLKLAFGAVLGSLLMAPVFAQTDQFPDVPENHWVYQALLNMKDQGILVGYPDGLFRGNRPASRYELAGAINSAYEKLRGMIAGLQSQVDALKNMTPGDDSWRQELERLRQEIASMRNWGQMITDLQRMQQTFEKDLAALGVDVEAMKRDLSDLAARVGRLEAYKPAVNIHGDVNAVMHAGHSTDGFFGLTVDGRPTGVGRGAYAGNPVGMDRDLTIGHELAVQLSGTNDTGPKWHGTLVVGNFLGFNSGGADGGIANTLYGNQSGVMANLAFHEQVESVYFQDLAVAFDTSIWGQGFTAELGRFGRKSGNFFFQRIDNTPYFDNPRWDDGNWYMDGADLMFAWGNVGLNVWGGRNSARLDTNEFSGPFGFFNELWPLTAGQQSFFASGALTIDRSLGADLNFKLGQSGDVMLHFMYLDSDNPTLDPMGSVFNRVNVWGGEVNFNVGPNLWVNGGYSQTNYMNNDSTTLDDDNFAWWAKANFNVSRVGVGVGYRHIEPYFGAPGDWGRVGFLWNPVDHEGVFADLTFNVMNNVNAKISGFWYQALNGAILPTSMEMVGVNANLAFPIAGTWNALLGWEYTQYRDVNIAGDDPTANWYRVGVSHNLADGSTLMFKYEMSRYDDEGSGFLGSFLAIGGDRRGGLLTTQWTRRY